MYHVMHLYCFTSAVYPKAKHCKTMRQWSYMLMQLLEYKNMREQLLDSIMNGRIC